MANDKTWARVLTHLDINDEAARQEIAARAEIRRFSARSSVIAQDDTDDGVYLILSGRARVALLSEDGQEIWLDSFEASDIIGELAALTGRRRNCGIVAETTVKAAFFPSDTFLELVRAHGELGLALAHLLARRIHHTTQRMYELSALSAPGRVYAELLRMCAETGQGHVIRPIPSLTGIARKVNSTRETVSRTVSDLEKRGLLNRLVDSLELVDPDLLARMSVER